MSVTTFQERIARIERRQPATPAFAPQRFAPPAAKARHRRRPGARRNLLPMASGGLLGVLMGALVQGAVLDGAPWGPGTAANAVAGLAGVAGLLASLPLLLLSVYLRTRRPGLFFFAVAYATLVIAVVLL